MGHQGKNVTAKWRFFFEYVLRRLSCYDRLRYNPEFSVSTPAINPSTDGTTPVDTYVIDIENLSHIQRSILIRLKTVDTAAYTELEPEELSGNAFNYHLRHVIAQKLIEKTDGQRYKLTARGRLLADNVSLETMRLKLRPTVGLILVLRSDAHGTLLYHSNRAPLRESVGLPFGKLRLGDTLENTFRRVLTKRGIDHGKVDSVESLGMANIRYFDKDLLVAHRVADVWAANYDGPAVVTSTDHGKSYWQKDFDGTSKMLPEVNALVSPPAKHGTIEIQASLP